MTAPSLWQSQCWRALTLTVGWRGARRVVGQSALRRDLEQLWTEHNRATIGALNERGALL